MMRTHALFPRAALLAVSLILPLVTLDLALKHWIRLTLIPGEGLPLWEAWIALTYVENRGVSFGLGHDLGGSIIYWAATLAACLAIAIFAHLHAVRPRMRAVAVLAIAGAVGNLVDRIPDGAVTDMFVVRYFPYVFNLADLYLTLAVVIWAVVALREGAESDVEGERATPAG